MAFYPADWSPVCTDQMALYNEILPIFHELNAEVVGISVDSAWCHVADLLHRRTRHDGGWDLESLLGAVQEHL